MRYKGTILITYIWSYSVVFFSEMGGNVSYGRPANAVLNAMIVPGRLCRLLLKWRGERKKEEWNN
jgi:hypothetical protein